MVLGNKIVKIIKTGLEGFTVTLKFSNGEIGTVSLHHIFSPPKNLAVDVLTGGMFHKCFIESGALAWPNGLELCPDSIFLIFKEQTRKKRAA